MTKETLEKANKLRETMDALNDIAHIAGGTPHPMLCGKDSKNVSFIRLNDLEDELKDHIVEFCNAKYDELKEEFDKL